MEPTEQRAGLVARLAVINNGRTPATGKPLLYRVLAATPLGPVQAVGRGDPQGDEGRVHPPAESGYADQPSPHREVRPFTGVTPAVATAPWLAIDDVAWPR